ncbi:hypothetical protein A2U01_0042889, partial [Trifolium medium]|nr:hypothetical protein [Trifolium medium]
RCCQIEEDKIPAESIDKSVHRASTSFHMALFNVRDEVAREKIDHVILEVVESEQTIATLIDASSCAIPEMQNVVIMQDDGLDEVAKVDIQVLKQLWVNIAEGEKSFTPYLTKTQKKNKRLTRSN